MRRFIRIIFSVIFLLYIFSFVLTAAEDYKTYSSAVTVNGDIIINHDNQNYTAYLTGSSDMIFNGTHFIKSGNESDISKKSSIYADGGNSYFSNVIVHDNTPGKGALSLSSSSSLTSSGTAFITTNATSPVITLEGNSTFKSYGDYLYSLSSNSDILTVAFNCKSELSDSYLSASDSSCINNNGEINIFGTSLFSQSSSAVKNGGDLRIYDSEISASISDTSETKAAIELASRESENRSSLILQDSNISVKQGYIINSNGFKGDVVLSDTKTMTSVGQDDFMKIENSDISFLYEKQSFDGNISISSSTAQNYFISETSFKGAITKDESSTVLLYISEDSSWIITSDSIVSELYAKGKITDIDGNTVTIKNSKTGTVYVTGNGNITILTDNYYTTDYSVPYTVPEKDLFYEERPEVLKNSAYLTQNDHDKIIDSVKYDIENEKAEETTVKEEETEEISDIKNIGAGGNMTAVLIIIIIEIIAIIIAVVYYASKGQLFKKKSNDK